MTHMILRVEMQKNVMVNDLVWSIKGIDGYKRSLKVLRGYSNVKILTTSGVQYQSFFRESSVSTPTYKNGFQNNVP